MNKKLMAIMSLSAIVMPLTAFAATDYTVSTENVVYSDPITADQAKNNCDISVSQVSRFSVKIPKTIILDGAVGGANNTDYTVVVKGNIASDEVITVAPDATVTMEDVKNVKASIIGDVTQIVTKFVNAEAKDKVYSTATDTIAIGVSDKKGTAAGNIEVKGLTAGF